MAEPVLDAPRVVAGIGQGVAAGMAQHVARVDDIALLGKPADGRSPKCIDCYQVTERSAGGAAFKLDPALLVYSLRWQHRAEPPDLELLLLQDEPQQWWVNTANLTLLGELRRRAPEAIDWTGMADVVPLLDAFEVAQESGTPRRH